MDCVEVVIAAGSADWLTSFTRSLLEDRDHGDVVPCVIAVPLVAGNPAYLRWVYEDTREPS